MKNRCASLLAALFEIARLSGATVAIPLVTAAANLFLPFACSIRAKCKHFLALEFRLSARSKQRLRHFDFVARLKRDVETRISSNLFDIDNRYLGAAQEADPPLIRIR